MRLLTVICLYMSVKFSQPECLAGNHNEWEIKLKRYLITCGYISWTSPNGNKTEPVDVRLHFRIKHFDYFSYEQEFVIYAWTTFSWKDISIKWDPSKYNGIQQTVRRSWHIWSPDIELLNSINDKDTSFLGAPCEITSDGKVKCMSKMIFQTKCIADLSDWPRDVQTCSLEFRAGKQNGIRTKIRLTFAERAVSMIGSEYGTQWNIIDYKQEATENNGRQLKMSFTLERHAKVLAATVIFPSVLLFTFSLLTSFLDVRRGLRLFLACFSLMCHFYFLPGMAMEIPEHCNNPPNILLYFRGSVIMTMSNVAVTLILKALCDRDANAPMWMTFINENVLKSHCKLLVFPRWTIENPEKSDNASNWTVFANVVNSVWAYISVIVYVVLFYVFVPSKRPWN